MTDVTASQHGFAFERRIQYVLQEIKDKLYERDLVLEFEKQVVYEN
jgi:hypothetical protein